jgi:hypothetical protein
MLALAIPDGTLALGAGTVLALGAAMLVLAPLLRDQIEPPRAELGADADVSGITTSSVEALREIEFDRETGKLSDDDYRDLKASYTNSALAEFRAKDAASSSASVDDAALERTIQSFRGGAARACVTCGPRPEPDAVFCSDCGRYLAGHCASCGARCDAEGQRFCADCGHSLVPVGAL